MCQAFSDTPTTIESPCACEVHVGNQWSDRNRLIILSGVKCNGENQSRAGRQRVTLALMALCQMG